MRYLIVTVLTFFAATFAFAQSSDAEMEARAQEIGAQLRCVVCQNQSIEESDASLAGDMRRLVRARLEAGDSNADVIDFMQERYGDYVLLKPPVQGNTFVLWFTPFVLVLLGLLWFAFRRQKALANAPLSEEERAKLDAILKGDDR
jgi:cytochrome c-type biogenesis protein CcmH